ncbi:MAG: type II toxin-antitoxin system HicB family antitoxin [Minisyncoccia bacterium]
MSGVRKEYRGKQLPVIIGKDEDGFYVVECPLFEGCYSQGRTTDEALKNIREAILLLLREKKNRDIVFAYHPKEVGLCTIVL